jgi:hypothetical protein
VHWPPEVGESLPRVEDAWYEWAKVENWVLSTNGHGPEWDTVFCVGLSNWTLVWHTMLKAAVGIPIKIVHDRSPFGFTCGADIWLTVNSRSALITLALHYPDKDSPPRLVTAYPNL